jgi:transposase-like protein
MAEKRIFAVVTGECPRCKSYRIKRITRQGIVERVIFPVLDLWPYRCQECDLKYFDYVRYAILRSERHSDSDEAEPS